MGGKATFISFYFCVALPHSPDPKRRHTTLEITRGEKWDDWKMGWEITPLRVYALWSWQNKNEKSPSCPAWENWGECRAFRLAGILVWGIRFLPSPLPMDVFQRAHTSVVNERKISNVIAVFSRMTTPPYTEHKGALWRVWKMVREGFCSHQISTHSNTN